MATIVRTKQVVNDITRITASERRRFPDINGRGVKVPILESVFKKCVKFIVVDRTHKNFGFRELDFETSKSSLFGLRQGTAQ